MRDLIKPTLMVVFGLMILFGARVLLVPSKAGFAQEANQMNPNDTREAKDSLVRETYVSEVVLQAPWAMRTLAYDGEESPPGELGLRAVVLPDSLRAKLPDPPLPEGPTSFTVAPNGDIYITDPLNKRIQRFNANGSFVSVIPIPPLEKSQYLHIQELPELSDSAKVESLRRAGKLPKTLDRNSKELKDLLEEPKTIDGYQYVWSLICVDQSNNVYLLWWGDYTKQTLCKYSQQGELLATYPLFPEVRIGGVTNKLHCDSSGKLLFEYSRRATDRIMLTLKEWDLSKKPRLPFTFQIGTTDRVFAAEEQRNTLKRGPLKKSKLREVELEAAIQSWKPSGQGLAVENMWNTRFVDEQGDLFRYWSTKEGIIIAKWHIQE